MDRPSGRRFPLYVHITTLFFVMLLAIGGLLAWLSYARSAEIIEEAVQDVFTRIVRETTNQLEGIVAPAQTALSLQAEQRVVRARNLPDRLDSLGFYARALESTPSATSVYAGYDDGDFFLVRKLDDPETIKLLNAPAGATYAVQSVERDARGTVGEFLFFDNELRPLGRDARDSYASYDPRERGWYKQASAAAGVIRTDPYVFFTTARVGVTLARRSIDPHAIVGIDIRLETVADLLKQQKFTPGTQLVIFDAQRRVIAADQIERVVRSDRNGERPQLVQLESFGSPALAHLGKTVATDTAPHPKALHIDGRDWHTAAVRLPGSDARPLFLALAVPDDELLAHARELRNELLFATAIVMLLAIPLTLVVARAVANPLRRLVGEADAIRHFDFTRPIVVSSLVQEVDDLAATMQGMKRTIRRFLDISSAIAAEDNFERLLPRLLNEVIDAAQATGGVLYLADASGTRLTAAAINRQGETEIPSEPVSFALDTLPALLQGALDSSTTGVMAGSVSAAELQTAQLDVDGFAAPAVASLAVPLYNRKQQRVGAMLLFGAAGADDAKRSFIGALSGTAAISLETRELVQAQKALFEAFIKLIASAIDAKSPYTGGHCARVPELTKMLARAACAADSGPFKDFALSEEAWEAVHVAAWLHDCGKVTTPEYVVDKATKLETIYDRIHEIRTRFEVLKRDAEIAALRRILDGEPRETAEATLNRELAALDADFAFVASCNEGGEFMAPEHLGRLQCIAARTWLRTLDDRIGISHEERERKAMVPAAPLPVQEALLADKPEHAIARGAAEHIGTDNPWGFRLDTPALRYNRGELYNLSIGRGTLTAEDRHKINDHIVQTIVMLSQLPFPKHLQQVPEIAGGHHEKMDGTGYPKRLTGSEMSPLARMMAIADIFEALTAIDRPYKKGKTLSEAIAIMARMRDEQHIDAELFALFLRAGVYRDYAQRFMQPQYVDAVDIERYLGAHASAQK
ncbi:HD domain-containing phosphohydrolase [Niveibacterium microcysteis]|nr:HD domain-containing phosphohydrolase [Niveibacterium microcysteis]